VGEARRVDRKVVEKVEKGQRLRRGEVIMVRIVERMAGGGGQREREAGETSLAGSSKSSLLQDS
jgi:hypothetical protein